MLGFLPPFVSYYICDMDWIMKLLSQYKQLDGNSNIDYPRLYFITYHSTAIEEASLTEMETHYLLKNGVAPADKPFLKR